MVSVRLPEVDVNTVKAHLQDEFRIEVPLMRWNDHPLIRVSIQAYNAADDMAALVSALERILF